MKSSPLPPEDQAETPPTKPTPRHEQFSAGFNFRGVELPQPDMDLLKHSFQTFANIQRADNYQPSKSGNNNLDDLFVALTSPASLQSAQLQASNEQPSYHMLSPVHRWPAVSRQTTSAINVALELRGPAFEQQTYKFTFYF